MGHVARLLEAAGIATVILAVRAFQTRLEGMGVARLVITPYPMGRPLGAPGDRDGQREVIMAALRLLEQAQERGTTVAIADPYRPYRL